MFLAGEPALESPNPENGGYRLRCPQKLKAGGKMSTGVNRSTVVVSLALCANTGAIAIKPCPSAECCPASACHGLAG